MIAASRRSLCMAVLLTPTIAALGYVFLLADQGTRRVAALASNLHVA
jgi:hypothetical protein